MAGRSSVRHSPIRVRNSRSKEGRYDNDETSGLYDYRAAALIHHQPGPGGGVFAGCDAGGQVFFRDFEKPQPKPANGQPIKDTPGDITLELTAKPLGDVSEMTLIERDNRGRENRGCS